MSFHDGIGEDPTCRLRGSDPLRGCSLVPCLIVVSGLALARYFWTGHGHG